VPRPSRLHAFCALVAAVALAPPPAFAEEAAAAVEEGKPAGGQANEPQAGAAAPETPAKQGETRKPKKSRKKDKRKKGKKKQSKKEAEAARKYQVDPGLVKAFEKIWEHLQEERFAEADTALGKLRLERLSPFERAQAHKLKAYVAFGTQQNETAIEELRQAIVEPDALPPRDRADVMFQIAQIQAGQARWNDAVATLQDWLQVVERPNSLGYYMLAMSYFQLEDLDAALPPAQKAVEIAKVPQQAWLQLLLAILITRQDYAAARPVLEQMIALYPNVGKEFWLQLSALHGITGNEADALGVLEIAHRKGLLTDDRDLLRLLQFTLARGIPYRTANMFEKAMEAKRFQDDPEALELLGISWILAREPAKALEPLSRAAELSKTGELYIHLAQIHLLDEEWEEAAAVLRKGLAKGGLRDTGTAQLMLGIAYYNEHKLEEARTWFAHAHRSGATREQAATWLEHVDREIEASRSTLGTGG
jgi:tetratricopeptide (TPR) repeat protein